MSDLTTLRDEITVSLYHEAATFEELAARNFLKNRSHYGIGILLRTAENRGYIYEKNDRYYTYKKIAKMKRFAEYEL